MTKYVLNSGGIKNAPDLKKQFHLELVSGLGVTPKFVLCLFAQGREYWEAKFQHYSDRIAEDLPEDCRPVFELAIPDIFEAQCQNADIIFIFGGDYHLLAYWMNQFKLVELFVNKVVATSSAGSELLARSFWTCDWRECFDGTGILPIKFIPHYQSDFGLDDPRGPINWQKAYDDLAAYGDKNVPIYALKEGEFKVFQG